MFASPVCLCACVGLQATAEQMAAQAEQLAAAQSEAQSLCVDLERINGVAVDTLARSQLRSLPCLLALVLALSLALALDLACFSVVLI